MDNITLTISTSNVRSSCQLTPVDVITLREVFHLALIQSEAILDDADEPEPSEANDAHSTVCRLVARIEAMLPDSTGFFD